jgi:hypothetical protein
MIPVLFKVKERGASPRGMKKVMNQASKESWFETGLHFHTDMRDKRFTQAHATQAGYTPRKKTYNWRKFKKYGHMRALELTGQTRRAVAAATISSTSKGNRVAYPGARAFNFRHPKSDVDMRAEFTKVLPQEADQLAEVFDRNLDQRLNRA